MMGSATPPGKLTTSSLQADLVWTGMVRHPSFRGTGRPRRPFLLQHVASDRQIVKLVVRARIRLQRTRRDAAFFDRLVDQPIGYERSPELTMLLPPRRRWPRPRSRHRRASVADGTNAQADALVDWIMRRWSMSNGRAFPWLRRLRKFCSRARKRLSEWSQLTRLQPPRVYATVKRRGGAPHEPDTFRCLSVFDLETAIMVSLVARYFRVLTDDLLLPSALAFRTGRGELPPDHHTAIERLIRFRNEQRPTVRRPLWAAEADIRGFFDSLVHDVARRAVADLLSHLPANRSPDQRALWFLESYLAAYSFNGLGRQQALRHANRRQKRPGHPASVPWPEDDLRAFGIDTAGTPIGVPQGGALSCFLANAVLHSADIAVGRAVPASEMLYLRYCDDIIIVTTSMTAATAALEAYLAELRRLQLPVHQPESCNYVYGTQPEGARFWASKSKKPYAWNAPGKRRHVPWLSFVGYQLRFDGVLRIRKSSIENEKKKQRHVARKAALMLDRIGQSRTRRSIITRLRDRLRSMAVGTTDLHLGANRGAFCWVRGFRLVEAADCVKTQLRDLDRYRGRQLARVWRKLEAGEPRKSKRKALKFLAPNA